MAVGAEANQQPVARGFVVFQGFCAHVALMVAALILSAIASAGYLRPLTTCPTSDALGGTYSLQESTEGLAGGGGKGSEGQWRVLGKKSLESRKGAGNSWSRAVVCSFSRLARLGSLHSYLGRHSRELGGEESISSVEQNRQSDASYLNHREPSLHDNLPSLKGSSSAVPPHNKPEGVRERSSASRGDREGMAPGMKFWDDWVDATDMEAMWARPDVLAEWTAAGEKQGRKVQMSRAADGKPVVTWTEMWAMSEIICERHFKNRVDPLTVCCVAEIESARQPLAYRFEPGLGEASTGLMQTLQSTAEWLARDMGYRAYNVDWAVTMLYKPFVSVYYGAAYLNWLSTYKGKKQSEEFIIRGYNGGPNGIHSKSTEHYWRRYLQTKAGIPRPHPAGLSARVVVHQTAAAVVVAGEHSVAVVGTSTSAAVVTGGGRYLGAVVRQQQQPEWTYWEERASADDVAAMWEREEVRREWQKAGEKVGHVRFSRDEQKQPYLTKTELIAVASIVVERHFQARLDVACVCAVAEASSVRMLDGRTGGGVMQVLHSTAEWLHRDMGFRAYPVTSAEDLQRPFTSIYYGAAYMSWLSRYGGERGEEFVARGYVGGPGAAAQPTTLSFWDAYKVAKTQYTQLIEKGGGRPCSLM